MAFGKVSFAISSKRFLSMKRVFSVRVPSFLMVFSINLIGSSVLERLFRKSNAFLSSWYPASIVRDTAL